MKFFKYLVLIVTGLTSINAYSQQETANERKTDSRDETAVREFVESKENIDIKKKANNLEISGDVRFVWQNQHEKGKILFRETPQSTSSNEKVHHGSSKEQPAKIDNHSDEHFKSKYSRLRGGGHVGRDEIPISNNNFNVKFNLKFKYDFDQTWAMGHLQFNNLAGITSIQGCQGEFPIFNESGDEIVKKVTLNRDWGGKGSGFGSAINLKRAYIGHTIFADGKSRLDLEVGRKQLDDLFMSEIQFNNYFDGAVFEFAGQIDQVSDWYLSAGAFVIDQRVDHFGWVAEIGFLNICDSKIDVRYSFIDWRKKCINRCFAFDPEGSRFEISQFTLAYQITPKILGYDIPMELYGAFLINTAAHKNEFAGNKKVNLGWYFDLYAGNARKKGDWSFEFIYAVVQAQAVPDFDVCGIGRGNIMNMNLTDYAPDLVKLQSRDFKSSDSSSLSEIEGYFPQQGNANYQGCLFDFLYAVTDNFLIDLSYEFSVAADKKIGGRHTYHSLEMEFLYAF